MRPSGRGGGISSDVTWAWLAAAAAHAGTRIDEDDPLRADLRALIAAQNMVDQAVAYAKRALHRDVPVGCNAGPQKTQRGLEDFLQSN